MMDDYIQQQTEFGPTDFEIEYDEVSSIFFCLQCLLYLEVAIYLLSKLREACTNLLYSTVTITKLFSFFVP